MSARNVWAVTISDRYGTGTELFETEASADACILAYCRERWNAEAMGEMPELMADMMGIFYDHRPDADIESECLPVKP